MTELKQIELIQALVSPSLSSTSPPALPSPTLPQNLHGEKPSLSWMQTAWFWVLQAQLMSKQFLSYFSLL